MLKRQLIVGSALTTALLYGATTHAQPTPNQAAETTGLENIVVTARRREESLQSQPLSVAAFSAATLDKMNIRQLADIQTIPNLTLTIQPTGMKSQVASIRGISQSDFILTLDQPVAIYVDGVLMPRSYGSLQDLIEPERIEVLRGPQGSLFGRNTTAGAINITLPRPLDQFGVSVKLGYASNNEITARGIVDTGILGSSGLKAKLAFQHHQNDGYVRDLLTNDASLWPGAYDTNTVYFNLDGDLGSIGTFEYKFDYEHNSASLGGGEQTTSASPDALAYFGASPTYGGAPFIVSRTRLGALYNFPSSPLSTGHVMGNALTLNFTISDQLNIKSITAYRNFSLVDLVHPFGQGNLMGRVLNLGTGTISVMPVSLYTDSFPGLFPNDTLHQHQISEELQISGVIGRHKYIGGLYYFDEEGGELSYNLLTALDLAFLPPGVGFNSIGARHYSYESASYAAYVSDSYTPPILDDKLEITGGMRYTIDRKWITYLTAPLVTLATANKYKRFGNLSGDATLKYQWTPDFMTYIRFASSYGSGGFSARDNPVVSGFNPEYVNNYEGGFKSNWLDNRVRLNADVFFAKYTDQQLSTFIASATSAPITHVANVASSQYLGSEVELTLLLAAGWDVEINWGHTWPHFNQFLYQPSATSPVINIAGSARFPFFQKTSFSIGTGYTFEPWSIGQLSLRLDYSYKSSMRFGSSNLISPLNESNYGGPQNVLNGSIELAHIPTNFGRTEMSVRVYGTNLLNKFYQVAGADFQVVPGRDYYTNGIFARPRVIGVNVLAKY